MGNSNSGAPTSAGGVFNEIGDFFTNDVGNTLAGDDAQAFYTDVGDTVVQFVTTGTTEQTTPTSSSLGNTPNNDPLPTTSPDQTYTYYVYTFNSCGCYSLADNAYWITPTLPPLGSYYLGNGYFFDNTTKGISSYQKNNVGGGSYPRFTTITVNFDATLFIPNSTGALSNNPTQNTIVPHYELYDPSGSTPSGSTPSGSTPSGSSTDPSGNATPTVVTSSQYLVPVAIVWGLVFIQSINK